MPYLELGQDTIWDENSASRLSKDLQRLIQVIHDGLVKEFLRVKSGESKRSVFWWALPPCITLVTPI